jgi:beta-glucanase (GH16 family)
MTSLTFEDGFDGPAGSAPDPAKWVHELGGGGWGNNELEDYVNDRQHSFLDGHGNLVIRATKNQGLGRRTVYKSARITTEGRFSQSQGHFEAKIQVNSQRGLWPAFWLLGDNITDVGWPQCGEIDVLEGYGWDPNVETSVHTPVSASDQQDQDINTVSRQVPSDAGWHVYRMDWTPARVAFSYDGTQYLAVTDQDIPNWRFGTGRPMFMVANLAVGGTGPGPVPADAAFPAEMLVDYVLVWA